MRYVGLLAGIGLLLAVTGTAGATTFTMPDGTVSCTPAYYAPYDLYMGYDVVVKTDQIINAQDAPEVHVTGTWDVSGLTDSSSSTWVAIGLIPKSRYDATWGWGDSSDPVYPNTFPGGSGEYVFNRGVFQLAALEGSWYYAKPSDFSGDYYGFPSVYEYWSGPASGRPPGMAPAKSTAGGGDATFSFDMRLLPNGGGYGGNMNLAVVGGNPGYTSNGYEIGGSPPTAPDGTGYDYGKKSVLTDPIDEDFSECYLYAALLVWNGSDPGLQSGTFSKVQVDVIPEPVTMAGLALGVGCLARYVRRRRA